MGKKKAKNKPRIYNVSVSTGMLTKFVIACDYLGIVGERYESVPENKTVVLLLCTTPRKFEQLKRIIQRKTHYSEFRVAK